MEEEQVRRRPAPSEYADYYKGYVDQVPDGDIIETLKAQHLSIMDLLAHIPEEKHAFRYADGKWTVKEVLGHLIDTEWVFTYRALRFARNDKTPLPGMDQDEFMAGADFGERGMDSLLGEFSNLRHADTTLFESFSESVLERTGVASGCTFTVRAILYIIAGHAQHHVNVLKEKYL